MPKRQQSLEQVNASLKRWQTRFRRALTNIEKLSAQKKRLEAKVATQAAAMICIAGPVEPVIEPVADVPPPVIEPKPDDLDVPTFLKRDPNADALKAMNRRIEERAAKRSKKRGDAKKMPLSGRAALEYIQKS